MARIRNNNNKLCYECMHCTSTLKSYEKCSILTACTINHRMTKTKRKIRRVHHQKLQADYKYADN